MRIGLLLILMVSLNAQSRNFESSFEKRNAEIVDTLRKGDLTLEKVCDEEKSDRTKKYFKRDKIDFYLDDRDEVISLEQKVLSTLPKICSATHIDGLAKEFYGRSKFDEDTPGYGFKCHSDLPVTSCLLAIEKMLALAENFKDYDFVADLLIAESVPQSAGSPEGLFFIEAEKELIVLSYPKLISKDPETVKSFFDKLLNE